MTGVEGVCDIVEAVQGVCVFVLLEMTRRQGTSTAEVQQDRYWAADCRASVDVLWCIALDAHSGEGIRSL